MEPFEEDRLRRLLNSLVKEEREQSRQTGDFVINLVDNTDFIWVSNGWWTRRRMREYIEKLQSEMEGDSSDENVQMISDFNIIEDIPLNIW